MSEHVTFRVISGVAGPCLVIGDYRIAGPKPWGGGRTLYEWSVNRADLAEELSVLTTETEEES